MIRLSQRGRLKIYLGYAAGVGKTYQMLLEAHRLRADGIDVVVGIAETHGRTETDALLEGLDVLPRRRVTYRGIEAEEMDLDALLARRPAVALVDELAHTNLPGSRNEKRYQDVEELIAVGIHVISTLNVQHLESLYETVERATGVKVRERVPDRIAAEADQIVNVDITAEDLRRRLRDGKVYTTERVELALEHFFRTSNLEQLRELTLRELAAQLDARSRRPDEEVPTSPDQVMVCLSSRGPNSNALLRYASRLAGRLNRTWYAVYVQTSRERPARIDAATQRALSDTLTLAQQLGATVFTYKGDDVVRTILQFAREYRVGHIVLGAPGNHPPRWRRLFGARGIAERLIDQGSGVTVVVYDAAMDGTALDAGPDVAQRTGATASPPAITAEDAAVPADRIRIWDAPVDKETAMHRLVDACLPDAPARQDAAWQALLERELRGVTFVGEDVAIPHARLAGLEHPIVGIGLAGDGMHDRASAQSARIMFLLLSPEDPPRAHLAMLGLISRLAQDDQWRRAILAARIPADAERVMRAWTERLASTTV